MKISRWLLVVLLATAVLGSAPMTSRADEASVPITGQDSLNPPEQLERWWGVAGAVLCGGEGFLLRTNPAIGLNPYVMAAGIGGCLLMCLDAAAP
jgi:hypothetical protein